MVHLKHILQCVEDIFVVFKKTKYLNMEETRDHKILRQFKDVMINGYINDNIEYKMNDDKKIKYRTNNFTSQ